MEVCITSSEVGFPLKISSAVYHRHHRLNESTEFTDANSLWNVTPRVDNWLHMMSSAFKSNYTITVTKWAENQHIWQRLHHCCFLFADKNLKISLVRMSFSSKLSLPSTPPRVPHKGWFLSLLIKNQKNCLIQKYCTNWSENERKQNANRHHMKSSMIEEDCCDYHEAKNTLRHRNASYARARQETWQRTTPFDVNNRFRSTFD